MRLIIRLYNYYELEGDELISYCLKLNMDVFNFRLFGNYLKNIPYPISNEEYDKCKLFKKNQDLKKETLVNDNDTIFNIILLCNDEDVFRKLKFIFKIYGCRKEIDPDDESEYSFKTYKTSSNESNESVDPNGSIKSNASSVIIEDLDLYNNQINYDSDDDLLNFNHDNLLNFNNDYLSNFNNDNLDDEINDNLDDEINDNLDDFNNYLLNNETDSVDEEMYAIDMNIDNEILNPTNLIDDEDFIHLLKIYRNKPEIFKTFYKFISSSSILNTKTNMDVDYEENLNKIKNLNLDIDDNLIIKALQITNNHLNLALRYLMFK